MRLWRIVGAVLVVGLVAAPALAQVTDDDLTAAELEIATTRAELEALAVELEAATVRSIELEVELDRLNRSVLETQVQVAAALERLQERAVALYTASTSNRVSLLFFSGTPEQLGAGISYLESLAIDDEMIINDLEGLRAEYERQQSVLADLEVEQEATLVRLDATAAQLNDRLGGAQSAYVALVDRKLAEEEEARRIEEERRLAEEAARAATSTTTASTTTTTTTVTTTTTPTVVEETTTTTTAETTTTLESTTTTTTIPSSAGMACPINGFTTFTDTWGAPRSGGRTHQGVDMLAARGTPTVAIESGTIRRLGSGGLGGITIWLTGQSGDEYYYAHLDDWAPGLSVGQAVGVGELIGFVGSTGNASYSVPHLHFELHPGGGSAVNPYALVKGLCG
ncbi:MAG: peptidoglycan DD-metalloendopeptidase family protein [Acidimicrobiia bacterium]|nr:peptidoglycan DD-metalloendopeptidase family protein [Acidimicrobiia bacterium]